MIEVTHDGSAGTHHDPYENCCFCRKPTPFWYRPKDVAVCKTCATVANSEDVPLKKDWFRREKIVYDSTHPFTR